MTETLSLLSLARLTASKSFWANFEPIDGAPEVGESSWPDRAERLTTFLALWSGEVRNLLVSVGDEAARPELSVLGEHEQAKIFRLLLRSIALATNSLLAFKRRDVPLDVPADLVSCAQVVFVQVEAQGIGTEDLTIQQVARRLVAASSQPGGSTLPITIDESGRVFGRDGERLFQFDPAKVLRGRAENPAAQSPPRGHSPGAER